MASDYQTTWHHIQYDCNLHIHCHGNLKTTNVVTLKLRSSLFSSIFNSQLYPVLTIYTYCTGVCQFKLSVFVRHLVGCEIRCELFGHY